ncbi:hypothetical protein HCBAA847_1264 [Helicobacter cinaedi CCUG 18818 = ATCC BAA-847]|uniref:Uncharacterized protein n=2 Tax=Helicobacter cinaedi TaxID=213 RepID=A0AAI8MP54_9HELI|nr:hypothetical protein [Helicobacter cinaedi]EFR47040.1 hypothetical protein HCCG_01588 [Helicobacter cinaedi CCUG 18818 = ATCC BAA-847]BAM32497.1 hypothetical protein HCBAA847_1264 [Helicobacter cinaedi CCUG 18818 = ATCC BAA-847]
MIILKAHYKGQNEKDSVFMFKRRCMGWGMGDVFRWQGYLCLFHKYRRDLYPSSNGEKNYEDVFVKMPRGMQPNEVRNPRQSSISQSPQTPQTPKDSSEAERLKDMQLNALKKSQDMLNAAIE